MPNRIIHEKALRSHTLARLSAEAERLFWRLTLTADDQGRFDAFPATVKAECFPILVDTLKTSKVHAWLMELGKECCGFYIVDGRPYGYFYKWSEYQRVYGNKPKFPQPPADCGNSPQSPALILNSSSTSIPTSISIGPPPVVPAKRGKRSISEEDRPTEKHHALGLRLGVDVGPEWGKFKNYCLAHDRRYADFEAAFRNWIARAAEMKGGQYGLRKV